MNLFLEIAVGVTMLENELRSLKQFQVLAMVAPGDRIPKLYVCEDYPTDAQDGDVWWPIGKPARIKDGDRWRLADWEKKSSHPEGEK